MNLFEEMNQNGHERILFCSDAASGLSAIIAIHSTQLGPAIGGCRMRPYSSPEAALTDALKLSKAMTYKAAISGLALGGGKSVILGDPKKDKSPRLLAAFAGHVAALGGRYIVGEDVGTDLADIEQFRQITPHVAGWRTEAGGTGDPAPSTALGVFYAMRAALEERFGDPSFSGRKIALQGVGKVGYALGTLLHQAGAKLFISDMDPERVALGCREWNADLLHPHEIYRVDCDLFAPCALGGILNERTIPALSCKIVAGSANNQLETPTAVNLLQEKGILYAPDYLINAGGLIHVAAELPHAMKDTADSAIEKIADRLKQVFDRARTESISTAEAADQLAETRLTEGAK
jgi:leucine dehydrogenase